MDSYLLIVQGTIIKKLLDMIYLVYQGQCAKTIICRKLGDLAITAHLNLQSQFIIHKRPQRKNLRQNDKYTYRDYDDACKKNMLSQKAWQDTEGHQDWVLKCELQTLLRNYGESQEETVPCTDILYCWCPS